MSIIELILIGIGLSMDAFAVSVTNGLCCKNIKAGKTIMTGVCFGGFQGLMPLIGYFLGRGFAKYITAFDHIIALILLGFIGGQMIWESFKKDEEKNESSILTGKMLFMQGIATSIDAFSAGISLSLFGNRILKPAILIGVVTFINSLLGFGLGGKLKKFPTKWLEITAGCLLILLGLKSLF